jgi:sugar transferase (PEP-CTERM/EpsH1 system associated)
VLMLVARVPWPLDDGWKMRTGNILKGLAAQGAEIDLISFGDPDQLVPDAFRSACARIQLVRRERPYAVGDLVRGVLGRTPFSVLNYRAEAFAQGVRDACRDTAYDLLLIEDVVMAQYAVEASARVAFLDMHNIESHLLQRYARSERHLARKGYAYLTARKLTHYERAISRRFDRVLVCSEEDRGRLRSGASDLPVAVVPNGIDPAYFSDAAVRPVDGSIVFVGSMDYHANISGVTHFVRAILPMIRSRHPNVTTYVVGKNPAPEVRALAGDDVVVTGAVDDVRPYVAAAAVSVVPLLVGGGTRLKILEAMAMGKAVVSTPVGAEGIPAPDGVALVLAEQGHEFADRVCELLEDRQRAEAIGGRAREFVLRHYDWTAIVDEIVDRFEELVPPTPPLNPRPVDA